MDIEEKNLYNKSDLWGKSRFFEIDETKWGVHMKKNSRRKKKSMVGPGIILALFFLIIVGIGAWIVSAIIKNQPEKEYVDQQRLSDGVAYILNMENKDAATIETEIKVGHGAAAKIDMEAEDFNVWSCFGDIVLMGDSRTKEFSHSELIEERRVLAEDGTDMQQIENYLGDLQVLNPSYIILQYGINDMENFYVWDSLETYVEDLVSKVRLIQDTVPNAVVFVHAIFPVVDPELSRLECRAEIPHWNEVIKERCEQEGIPYMDLAYLADMYPEYYEPDGMHFTIPFYTYWAKAMIAEVQRYEGY